MFSFLPFFLFDARKIAGGRAGSRIRKVTPLLLLPGPIAERMRSASSATGALSALEIDE
jgi:hypothetical protein